MIDKPVLNHLTQDDVAKLMADPYFDRPPPKSLDRLDFDAAPLAGLSAEDGAATLVAFTCGAVSRSLGFLPAPPRRWGRARRRDQRSLSLPATAPPRMHGASHPRA